MDKIPGLPRIVVNDKRAYFKAKLYTVYNLVYKHLRPFEYYVQALSQRECRILYNVIYRVSNNNELLLNESDIYKLKALGAKILRESKFQNKVLNEYELERMIMPQALLFSIANAAFASFY